MTFAEFFFSTFSLPTFPFFPFGTTDLFRVFVLCQKFSKLLSKAEGKRAFLSTHLFTLISLAYFPALLGGGNLSFAFTYILYTYYICLCVCVCFSINYAALFGFKIELRTLIYDPDSGQWCSKYFHSRQSKLMSIREEEERQGQPQ